MQTDKSTRPNTDILPNPKNNEGFDQKKPTLHDPYEQTTTPDIVIPLLGSEDVVIQQGVPSDRNTSENGTEAGE
jgi:hypothetical protein